MTQRVHNPIARFLFGRTFDIHDLIALAVQISVLALAAWLGAVLAHAPALEWLP